VDHERAGNLLVNSRSFDLLAIEGAARSAQ
jgi:hypothetical protein